MFTEIEEDIDNKLKKMDKEIKKGLIVVGIPLEEKELYYKAKKLYIKYIKKFEVVILSSEKYMIKVYDFYEGFEDYRLYRKKEELDDRKSLIQFNILICEQHDYYKSKVIIRNGKKEKQLVYGLK